MTLYKEIDRTQRKLNKGGKTNCESPTFPGILPRCCDGLVVRLLPPDLLLHHHPLHGHRADGAQRRSAEAAVATARRKTFPTSGIL